MLLDALAAIGFPVIQAPAGVAQGLLRHAPSPLNVAAPSVVRDMVLKAGASTVKTGFAGKPAFVDAILEYCMADIDESSR